MIPRSLSSEATVALNIQEEILDIVNEPIVFASSSQLMDALDPALGSQAVFLVIPTAPAAAAAAAAAAATTTTATSTPAKRWLWMLKPTSGRSCRCDGQKRDVEHAFQTVRRLFHPIRSLSCVCDAGAGLAISRHLPLDGNGFHLLGVGGLLLLG